MTYQATDIAKYIINKCTIEKHAISNLQLQEILYYIQKKFLEIGLKAWPSGPVIPEVYYIYCGFGALDIRMKYDIHLDSNYIAIIDPTIEQKRLLNPLDMIADICVPGKAWCQIYDKSRGNHCMIPKESIKDMG